MTAPKSRLSLLFHELKVHLPFTLLGVLASIICLYFFQKTTGYWKSEDPHALFDELFHFAHFAHILLSAVTSAAIFFRHHQSWMKAIGVGAFSSLLFCTLSDVLLPYLGGFLLKIPMEFHWDLIEAPMVVLASAFLGALFGLVAEVRFGKITYLTHGSHVFISSLASLFYLVTFGVTDWQAMFVQVFLITTFAVVIPCCSSDILFPLSLVGGFHGHEHEDEHTKNL